MRYSSPKSLTHKAYFPVDQVYAYTELSDEDAFPAVISEQYDIALPCSTYRRTMQETEVLLLPAAAFGNWAVESLSMSSPEIP